jgi:hypothetical protein
VVKISAFYLQKKRSKRVPKNFRPLPVSDLSLKMAQKSKFFHDIRLDLYVFGHS